VSVITDLQNPAIYSWILRQHQCWSALSTNRTCTIKLLVFPTLISCKSVVLV